MAFFCFVQTRSGLFFTVLSQIMKGLSIYKKCDKIEISKKI